MKKLVVLLVATIVVGVVSVSAKTLPTVAAKVPADVKSEIIEKVNYPSFERNHLIEGEVWMKFTLSEDSHLKVLEVSSTDKGLGEHVKNQLTDAVLQSANNRAGETYYLKLKFDLITAE